MLDCHLKLPNSPDSTCLVTLFCFVFVLCRRWICNTSDLCLNWLVDLQERFACVSLGFFFFFLSNGFSHCGLRLSSWALVLSEGLWSWLFYFFIFVLGLCFLPVLGNHSKREPASHFHRALFPVPANWSAHCAVARAPHQLFVALVTDSCHRDGKHGLHFWHANITILNYNHCLLGTDCVSASPGLSYFHLLKLCSMVFYHSCVEGELPCLTSGIPFHFLIVLYWLWRWHVRTSKAELVLGKLYELVIRHDCPLIAVFPRGLNQFWRSVYLKFLNTLYGISEKVHKSSLFFCYSSSMYIC